MRYVCRGFPRKPKPKSKATKSIVSKRPASMVSKRPAAIVSNRQAASIYPGGGRGKGWRRGLCNYPDSPIEDGVVIYPAYPDLPLEDCEVIYPDAPWADGVEPYDEAKAEAEAWRKAKAKTMEPGLHSPLSDITE